MNPQKLNRSCSMLMGGYYILLYMTYILFSAYLLENGYTSSFIAVMMSVSGIVTLCAKPLYALAVDSGKCKLTALILVGCMALGYGYFFLSAKKGVFAAVVLTVLGSGADWGLMDLADSWVMKLAKQSGIVDYGKVRAVGSITFAVTGLVYGAALTAFGYRIAVWCILFMLVCLALVILSIPDPQREERKKDSAFIRYFSLFSNKRYLVFVAFTAVTSCLFSLSDGYAPVLIMEKGGTAFHTGLFSFLTAAIEFFMLRRFTSIADRLGTDKVMTIGMVGFGIKGILMAIAPNVVLLLTVSLTQFLSFSFYVPGRMRFYEEEMSGEDLARSMTLTSIIDSLFSSLIGNPLAKAVIERKGTAAMLLVFGFGSLVSGILYYITEHRLK